MKRIVPIGEDGRPIIDEKDKKIVAISIKIIEELKSHNLTVGDINDVLTLCSNELHDFSSKTLFS